ncbi:MAG: YkgJ family cysteine cluster protein [Deltaproteobacteria bacterium]|nr:YkgJ family cysteine cluster protein [Deltaproteobacteria bacterium]
MSAIVPFKGLREGVAAVRTQRGLLFLDAYRWQLYLVPHTQQPQEAFKFLLTHGLAANSPVPPEQPRKTQMFSVQRDEAPAHKFIFSDQARFQCSGCGTSCRSFRLGPLLPADVDGLLSLDWSGTEHAQRQFFVDRRDTLLDGEALRDGREVFLRRANGGCQFLREDNLCEVHARFGYEKKPHTCRAFPLQLRSTPSGVHASLRLNECSRAEAADNGPSIADDEPAIRGLWNQVDKVSMLPALVWLSKGRLVGWEEYEALERSLLESPPAGGGVEFLLRCCKALSAQVTPPDPCAPAALAALCEWPIPSGLPVARAARLDAAGLTLEEGMARLSLFSKDAFDFPDVLTGIAHQAIAAHLARGRALDQAGREGAPEATARHVNEAATFLTRISLREHLAASGLDALAVVAAMRAFPEPLATP